METLRKRLQAVTTAVVEWHRGEYIPPENGPGETVVFLMGHYERPRLVVALDAVGKFCLEHWKWIITTAIALVALSLKWGS